jgi:cell division protein FtsQ
VSALSAALALPRAVLRPNARRLVRWGLALGLLLALLAGGWLWLRDSSFVAVEQVEVIGARGPDGRAIRAALDGAARDMTTLHVRRDALRAAVAGYGLVHDLRVVAHPPHRLSIVVVAERPVAWLAGTGTRTAATADGKPLHGLASGMALPTVPAGAVRGRAAGGHARATLAAAAAVPAPLRRRVLRLAWTGAHELVATLRGGGPDVRLGGADRLAAKWIAAVRVLADGSSTGARWVDVTVPERPAAGGLALASNTQAGVQTSANSPLSVETSPICNASCGSTPTLTLAPNSP